MENFQDIGVWIKIGLFYLDSDPVFKFLWIRIRFSRLDPDPVFPESLDPEPVNIRPDPKPCQSVSRQSAGLS